MERCSMGVEREAKGVAEAIVFDLLCWWQERHPDLPISELPNWWLDNRGVRTEAEFFRLLEPALDVMGYQEERATLLATSAGQLRVERKIFQYLA